MMGRHKCHALPKPGLHPNEMLRERDDGDVGSLGKVTEDRTLADGVPAIVKNSSGAIFGTSSDSSTKLTADFLDATGRGQQGPFIIMLFCVEPLRTWPLLSALLGPAGSHWSLAFVSPTENLAYKIYGDRPSPGEERCFALHAEREIPDASTVLGAVRFDRGEGLEQLKRDAEQLHDEQFRGKRYNVMTRNCQDWVLQHYAAIASKHSLPPFRFPLTGKVFAMRFAAAFSLYWVAFAAVQVKRQRRLETPFLHALFRDRACIPAK